MTPIAAELRLASFVFLVLYVVLMVLLGVIGQRRVRSADDFATARQAYGPLFLALALTATTASGATFLGLPGIAYQAGLPALWYAFLYPIGVYGGVLVCLRIVSRSGESFGTRSIPEYLGDRYGSGAIRVIAALFSLMLLFYLAGQLVAGLVMFERMLGLSQGWALGITSAVLLVYVTLGGAHADILTDGVQGALMLLLAFLILILFAIGYGVAGGFDGMLERLGTLDPRTLRVLNPGHPLVDSCWDLFAIVVSHLPLGLLPHIGNKLWALDSRAHRRRFIALSFCFGLLLPLITLGGILARALLGDELLASGGNEAIPVLFIQIFPAWLAALLGAGILAAVMSTADGLLVSSSQIFANDLYRRTFAPRWHPERSEAEIDRTVLSISRYATVAVLCGAAALAWALLEMNVALLVWIGIGGMMAALAGPLLLGALWRGVTRTGALFGFVTGAVVFALTHAGLLGPAGFEGTALEAPLAWLAGEASSPYSCATLGEIAGIAVTAAVSLVTQPLAKVHLARLFDEAA
jgi:SSS family transporter